MTEQPHTSRPENGGDVFTVRGLHAFFSLWIDSLERLDAERDRRYEERHISDKEAVAAALAAAKEAVAAALTAQKEAVTKAEESQKLYNQGHNDLQRKMEAQYKDTLPRTEADSKFKTHDDKIEDVKADINDLRLSRSEGQGVRTQVLESRAQSQWTFERVLTIAALVLGGLYFILQNH